LLSWLAREAPEVHAGIIAADRASVARFGHGSAMASAHGHLILPLANARDRDTQVAWGIADFIHRFGRRPDGMWLPETAVDLSTLDALARQGIGFTLLAPHQAVRFRAVGAPSWTEVGPEGIPTHRSYLQRLPSGRSIALFFYDGSGSRGVAFDGLLHSGPRLVDALVQAVGPPTPEPRLGHIATDGESYGHHHRFGEMCLDWALGQIDAGDAAQLTNYAAFLQRHPPTWEVEVREGSSWSCAHGLGRWREDCGCRMGTEGDQRWRRPLRDALDDLRDGLQDAWEARAAGWLHAPWAARDDYIDVLLDGTVEARTAFLEAHQRRRLGEREAAEVVGLMALQQELMSMYTSCGWFFDDVGGIETVQILRHAVRAVELAEQTLGVSGRRERLANRLDAACSHSASVGTAGEIVRRLWRERSGG